MQGEDLQGEGRKWRRKRRGTPFPVPALQAQVRGFGARRRKNVTLVSEHSGKASRGGGTGPWLGTGWVAFPSREEGLGEVWCGWDEEEEGGGRRAKRGILTRFPWPWRRPRRAPSSGA